MSEVINHSDRAHSNLGASSASRWMACPASVALSDTVPDKRDSKFAAEGTCAHELAEKALLSETHQCSEFIGEEYEDYVVTAEMAEFTQMYVDYVLSKEDDFSDVLIEERFSLSSIKEGMFGTNDACIVKYGKSVEIIDLKYGKGVEVQAENNKQLQYYALGVLESLGEGYFFEEIRMTIVQPRVDTPIKTWVISVDQLMEFREELVKAVAVVDSGSAHFATGDHCKFCKAKAICPQNKKEIQEIFNAPVAEEEVKDFPEPNKISVDSMVNILNNAKRIKSFIDAVEEYAKGKLLEGHTIPQYKLVEGRASRKLRSEGEFMLEFGEDFGDDLYTKPKLKSVAQLEKVVGKEAILPHVEVSKGVAMVHESNKKKAISMEKNTDLLEEADLMEDF